MATSNFIGFCSSWALAAYLVYPKRLTSFVVLQRLLAAGQTSFESSQPTASSRLAEERSPVVSAKEWMKHLVAILQGKMMNRSNSPWVVFWFRRSKWLFIRGFA